MLNKIFALSILSFCLIASAQSPTSVMPPVGEEGRVAAVKTYLSSIGKIESVKKVKANDSELLVVAYVLSPTRYSYIRCAVALPQAEVWTGRLIGLGNTGFPTEYTSSFYNWQDFYKATGFTENLANPGSSGRIPPIHLGIRFAGAAPHAWFQS